MLNNVFSFTSERQKLLYLSPVLARTDVMLTMATGPLAELAETTTWAVELILRRKGIVTESFSWSVLFDKLGEDDELKDVIRRLGEVRARISSVSLRGGWPQEGTRQQELARLYAAREELEAQISRMAGASVDIEPERVTVEDVRGRLPRRAVLVEFMRRDTRELGPTEGGNWKSPHYLAAVIRPDAAPQLIDLGDAMEIDRILADYRSLLSEHADRLPGGAQLLSEGGPAAAPGLDGMRDALSAAGGQLYDRLIAPLGDAVSTAGRVLISPDAELAMLPFGALPHSDGGYLVEHQYLSYLPSGRSLARRATQRGDGGGPAVIVGGVEFGWRDETGASTGELPRALRALLGATDDADGIPVPELPGTAAEARRIAELLDRQGRIRPVLLSGSRATEARVRAVESPFLLHFATHGFFLPDPERLHPQGLQLAGPAARRSLRAAQQTLSNPLLRSGLLLVGSESFLNAGRLDRDGHDGILTAEDVAGLSLPNTRLVVLSACETSLGDIHRGEGVLGLRRAFGMAGAQNVVSTLWKVDDAATQSLMTAFYKEFLDNGEVCTSLTDVMRRMVHTLRARIGCAHPYYWAAFVPDGPC